MERCHNWSYVGTFGSFSCAFPLFFFYENLRLGHMRNVDGGVDGGLVRSRSMNGDRGGENGSMAADTSLFVRTFFVRGDWMWGHASNGDCRHLNGSRGLSPCGARLWG